MSLFSFRFLVCFPPTFPNITFPPLYNYFSFTLGGGIFLVENLEVENLSFRNKIYTESIKRSRKLRIKVWSIVNPYRSFLRSSSYRDLSKSFVVRLRYSVVAKPPSSLSSQFGCPEKIMYTPLFASHFDSEQNVVLNLSLSDFSMFSFLLILNTNIVSRCLHWWVFKWIVLLFFVLSN